VTGGSRTDAFIVNTCLDGTLDAARQKEVGGQNNNNVWEKELGEAKVKG
jgi:hypothetical protein